MRSDLHRVNAGKHCRMFEPVNAEGSFWAFAAGEVAVRPVSVASSAEAADWCCGFKLKLPTGPAGGGVGVALSKLPE